MNGSAFHPVLLRRFVSTSSFGFSDMPLQRIRRAPVQSAARHTRRTRRGGILRPCIGISLAIVLNPALEPMSHCAPANLCIRNSRSWLSLFVNPVSHAAQDRPLACSGLSPPGTLASHGTRGTSPQSAPARTPSSGAGRCPR